MRLELSTEAATAISVATGAALVGCVVAVAVFLVRIPPDYFLQKEKPARTARDWLWKIGKNLLGVIFVVAGAIMLPLPGPGSLVLVLGLSLVDFPGRPRLVRWFISRPTIARVIDWLRRRHGRPPLLPRPPRERASRTAPAHEKHEPSQA